ncbi:hypothetical protein [Rhizobium wuzhouense]|uniref:GcrA cell cycle regulator n=1 Tax=Rhizobium wuzhouense TaxID=1986026 RepID=A0ABX5NMQ7_9HYPH|nr:hypothetical protein [Rhizobium wuzhouense]PYB71288.1 hypothetical protein DMY87_18190 [Rhizobium wuzhouense]
MNANHLAPGWSTADAAALKTLWFAGATEEEIAEALGKTKGQVSGRVNRHRDAFGFRQKRAAEKNRGKMVDQVWQENRP